MIIKSGIKKVFVTGGAGYIGARLVPSLLKEGYKVTVLDLMIYGRKVLKKHASLKIIKGDIRNKNLLIKAIKGHDALIHLACISNDPSFELNPKLGKSINLKAFEPLVQISKNCNIKRFIFASSSSVYGIKKNKNVHEKMSLKPLTDYSKFKADCEKILLKYQSQNFSTVILRPATVCGYSRRQRLDVVVNLLTNLAYHKREISIFGGKQLRPNIHIKDMVKSYLVLLKAPKKLIAGETFNVGFKNDTVLSLAKKVRKIIGNDVKLVTVPSNDNRSYHISSSKISRKLGFVPSNTIDAAIKELKLAFIKRKLKNPLSSEYYFNIKRMQSINLK